MIHTVFSWRCCHVTFTFLPLATEATWRRPALRRVLRRSRPSWRRQRPRFRGLRRMISVTVTRTFRTPRPRTASRLWTWARGRPAGQCSLLPPASLLAEGCHGPRLRLTPSLPSGEMRGSMRRGCSSWRWPVPCSPERPPDPPCTSGYQEPWRSWATRGPRPSAEKGWRYSSTLTCSTWASVRPGPAAGMLVWTCVMEEGRSQNTDPPPPTHLTWAGQVSCMKS